MDNKILEEQKRYLQKLQEQKKLASGTSNKMASENAHPSPFPNQSEKLKKVYSSQPMINPENFKNREFKNIDNDIDDNNIIIEENEDIVNDLTEIKENLKENLKMQQKKQQQKNNINNKNKNDNLKNEISENINPSFHDLNFPYGNENNFLEDEENRKILERTILKTSTQADEADKYNNPMYIAKKIMSEKNSHVYNQKTINSPQAKYQKPHNHQSNQNYRIQSPENLSMDSYFPQGNPLAKHFRKPGISIRLPSNLLYYEEGEIFTTPNGEIEIYPLTIKDEMYLKNPDGLNSGQSLYRIIQSCCPGIRNPESILNPDLDAILIGIRICSYGKIMEIETKCPKCNTENAYGIDLQDVIDTANIMDNIPVLEIDGLKILIKPYSLKSNLKISDFTFEQTKIITLINKDDVSDDEKIKYINTLSEKIIDLQESLICDSILYIETEDGIKVDNKKHILEWVKNAPSNHIKEIEDFVLEMNKTIGIKKEFELTCKSCENKWNTTLTYDPTSFFKKNSLK